jgi:ATP-dependent 26S proteasome regulatory subunit
VTTLRERLGLGASSVDRNKYQIQIPLPPKIDPTVTMMTVEEKPDITYADIGGCDHARARAALKLALGRQRTHARAHARTGRRSRSRKCAR